MKYMSAVFFDGTTREVTVRTQKQKSSVDDLQEVNHVRENLF